MYQSYSDIWSSGITSLDKFKIRNISSIYYKLTSLWNNANINSI